LTVVTALAPTPVVSIVVPTLNERDNVQALVEAVAGAMGDIAWELIFVDDDSRDGTAETAKAIARRDPRVRCIRRVGRRGLSSAGIEGFLSSAAPFVALMDADLQHDQQLLPRMLEALRQGDTELVVASRYVEGGSAAGLSSKGRSLLSRAGGELARRLLGLSLTDPMSGYFMMRREVFDGLVPRLSAHGFKLLADIVASSQRPLSIRELPMEMRARHAGESKLDAGVSIDFLILLADKTVGRFVPVRFIMFSIVGALGVVVHLAALYLYHFGLGAGFALAQGLAGVTAMTTNFLINNQVTYRDRRLKGLKLLVGLLSFYAVCSVGLIVNVGVADALFERDNAWWVSGVLGALVGAVWNYAVSSVLTWRTHR
jgi:dolichol-phosphate mannosyltransferase